MCLIKSYNVEPAFPKQKQKYTRNSKHQPPTTYSFMPVALATRKLWRMDRSSMISSEPPGMA